LTDTEPQLQVSFSSFVVGLATSAMGHLGEGPGQGVDLELARNTIDLLGILQEKTAGNLDEEEKRLLDTLLYETRLRFVAKSEGKD
jgi:hypothetical protein